jgi:hypothetical protein
MATRTVTVTEAPTLVAAAAVDRVLVSWSRNLAVQFATADDGDAVDSAEWHSLPPGSGITRDLIGPGDLYAKLAPGSTASSVALAVS